MDSDTEISLVRRRALMIGGSIAAGFATNLFPQVVSAAEDAVHPEEKFPVKEIEEILRVDGKVTNGVLGISMDRSDLHVTGQGGIPFKPAWQANHEFAFQSLGGGKVIVTGELSLLSKEANPVIDQIIKHGLVFQAFHQHFFDLSPQLFHIHFRAIGHPLDIARAIAAVVAVTATPLPQKSSKDPKTSLDKDKLEKILGGTAEVADDGVVIVNIPRKETIILDGVPLKAEMGVAHAVTFEPLAGGKGTAVAPDFALIASEINPLVQSMRENGFTIHCLYNQETAENPQLYFSHQLAVGDAYDLARKIRKVLEGTNTKFSS